MYIYDGAHTHTYIHTYTHTFFTHTYIPSWSKKAQSATFRASSIVADCVVSTPMNVMRRPVHHVAHISLTYGSCGTYQRDHVTHINGTIESRHDSRHVTNESHRRARIRCSDLCIMSRACIWPVTHNLTGPMSHVTHIHRTHEAHHDWSHLSNIKNKSLIVAYEY